MLGILGRTGGSRIGLLLSKPEIGEIRDLPRKLHPPRSLVNVGVDLLDASKYFGYSVSTLEARAMRYRLLRDDSSHWYAVPEEWYDEFIRWVTCSQEEFEDWQGHDFGQYRLNHSVGAYTFMDFKLDARN